MAGYQDLEVWKLGIDLALDIYRVTAGFPKEELYGLTSQLRRAAVSIPSNIAEGHARKAPKEMVRFAGYAKGSLAEVETQVIIAEKLRFAPAEQMRAIMEVTERESRMLSGLIRAVQRHD